MGIVLTRIDSRLIHGQVLEAWVPHIKADCIVVANDQVAAISFQKMIMAAAVPKGIRVFIGSVAEVAGVFASHELDSNRVLLLFATSEDALNAYEQGLQFSDLNLGNMHGGEGKERYSCTIALNSEDVENLNRLESKGVRIVSQCVPPEREQSWHKLLGGSGG